MVSRRTVVARRSALAAPVLCALGGLLAMQSTVAQRTSKPEPRKPKESFKQSAPLLDLKEGEKVRFPTPAPTSMLAWDYCDGEGNIYLVYGTAPPRPAPAINSLPNLSGSPVTRLTLDSRSVTEYPTPSLSGYQALQRLTFSVDHWGDVYEMFSDEVSQVGEGEPDSGKFLVEKFNHDGSVDSGVELGKVPFGRMWPTHFEPFANGNLLVMGQVSVAGHGSQPFTGIFDSNGNFVQEVNLPSGVSPKPRPGGARGKRGKPGATPSAEGSLHEKTPRGHNPAEMPAETNWAAVLDLTTVVAGPEDTVYLLQPSNPATLYTVSSDGQVLREVHVRYPGPNLRVVDVSPAGRSSVLVEFFGTKPDGMGGFRGYFIFALVDPRTGKTTAVYRLPKKAGGFFACAAGPDDFEFIRSSKKRKLEVVKFSGE